MVIVHGGFGCLWRRQEAAVVVGGEVVSCFWKKVWIGQVGCEMNGEKGLVEQRGRLFSTKIRGPIFKYRRHGQSGLCAHQTQTHFAVHKRNSL